MTKQRVRKSGEGAWYSCDWPEFVFGVDSSVSSIGDLSAASTPGQGQRRKRATLRAVCFEAARADCESFHPPWWR
jgi:hypothetical protein